MHLQSTQNVEYLSEHISKIISQNEAIVEGVAPALQKKYHKITGISRGYVPNDSASSKLAVALQKQREDAAAQANYSSSSAPTPANAKPQQPIVSVSPVAGPSGQQQQQRRALQTLKQHAQQVIQTHVSAVAAQQQLLHQHTSTSSPLNLSKLSIDVLTNTHPQNPERSIIKDLLLNSRGLAVPSGGEGEDAIYTCPLCRITFRSADNLQYHTQNYCQGQPHTHANSPQSAPISPVGSPSHKYFRSNSFNGNLPEKCSPNTLAKLASSTLAHPSKTPPSLAKLAQTQIRPSRFKPDNIVINTDTCPAPLPLSVDPHNKPGCSSNPTVSTQCALITKLIEIDAPLPSPGPLLGKTRLVDSFQQADDRKTEEAIISHFPDNDSMYQKHRSVAAVEIIEEPLKHSFRPTSNKRPRNADAYAASTSRQMFTDIPNGMHNHPRMSGGDVKIVERRDDPYSIMSPNTVRQPQMSGGEFKIVERRNEPRTEPRFGSSGGSIVPIASTSGAQSPAMHGFGDAMHMQMGLHSGGSLHHMKEQQGSLKQVPHFVFPPINPITAYNPLTLPVAISQGQTMKIMHAGKLIPFVPGMPGPNSYLPPQADGGLVPKPIHRGPSPNRRMVPSPLSLPPTHSQSPTPTMLHAGVKQALPTPRSIPIIRVADVDNLKPQSRKLNTTKNGFHHQTSPGSFHSPTAQFSPAKKKFNFSRMADNLSPRKPLPTDAEPEHRYFDFEKPGMLLRVQDVQPQQIAPLHIDVSSDETQSDQPSQSLLSTTTTNTTTPKKPTKFLRPCSLPLKPGTFTPKHHHGITPTANTLPLISPETPRPSKNCVQLYLNGHAYTYLGLKCSTKTFYCTVNRPQPVHFTNQHKLSIYSNWQICAESNPHPMGLSPKTAMALYDSRQLPMKVSIAKMGPTCIMLHSQSLLIAATQNDDEYRNQSQQLYATNSRLVASGSSTASSGDAPLHGGYESTEDYTYVRGRGRGKYVCSECGIRCKKPSMLKKHIRTHTDVRPYTCTHCSFSFKTKGNLTKHMKSKAHYKKCKELGLNPVPIDDDGLDDDHEGDSLTSGDQTSTMPGDDSDSDDMSDGDDGGNDSSGENPPEFI